MCSVYTAAQPISHLSSSLPRFLRPDLCLHLLPSLLCPVPSSLLILVTVLQLARWDNFPANQGAFSSLQGWWNTGHQSNTASLAVAIQSWSQKSVYLVGLIRRFLISFAHPNTSSETHSTLVCRHKFHLSLNLNPFKGAIIRFSFVIIQPSSRLL